MVKLQTFIQSTSQFASYSHSGGSATPCQLLARPPGLIWGSKFGLKNILSRGAEEEQGLKLPNLQLADDPLHLLSSHFVWLPLQTAAFKNHFILFTLFRENPPGVYNRYWNTINTNMISLSYCSNCTEKRKTYYTISLFYAVEISGDIKSNLRETFSPDVKRNLLPPYEAPERTTAMQFQFLRHIIVRHKGVLRNDSHIG